MTCPLCEREPRTHLYHEDDLCWVVDCSSCGTPMIVWKAHTDQLTPAENQHVCQVLLDLFGHFEVDGLRRTHPEHWHAHLRGERAAACVPADNPGGLQRRTARTRQGWLFETGVPVTFRAMRNTEPSVWMGSQFGQDIEPAGTYLLVDDAEAWKDPRAQVRGWVFFEQHFSNPLVIATVADDHPMASIYGPTGWKRRLSEAFGGRTGAELTQAILAAGHDGVVTVGPARDDAREVVDLTRLPRSAAMRAKKNPLDPEAWAAERDPCALSRPMGPCPDDREGVHFALGWGLAARYALFKASRSSSIGIVLTYDLDGLPLEPDHDAVIEKAHGDYMVRDISYYIEEFDILEDPDDPDYDRLASLMEGEAERESEGREPTGDYSVEQQLIENAKGSIFMLLADRLTDPETQDQALSAIKDVDVPKDWWAEAIGQMRTFSVVGDDRLLRVQALKPIYDSIGVGDEPDFDEAACPAQLTIEDLDFALADTLERMAVTLWESPRADAVVEPHFHGTDLTRAEVILAAAPAAAELKNPWDPCTQP